MIVRNYRDSDLEAMLELHRRQGLEYELPELGKMAVGAVIEEGGKVTHGVFLRNITEAYWLFDPAKEWKRQTLGRLLVLHGEVEKAAARRGIEEVDCWIPPEVLTPAMNNTMLRLGWQRPLWPCYRHQIAPVLVGV